MKVQAWECKHCGKLFKKHQAATTCKNKCAKKIANEKAAKKLEAEMQARSDEIRLGVSYIEEVPGLLIEFVKKYLNGTLSFSKWEMAYKEKMATTHDSPIGQNRSGWGKDTKYHAGWEGQVSGTTTLYKKPFKLSDSGSSFDNVDDFADLFDGFGKRLIRGIHTGGGNGGEKFNYTIRMYVDDFPKIKATHDIYIPLRSKHNTYIEQVKQLAAKAKEEVVNRDKKVSTLKDIDKLFRLKLKEVEVECNKAVQNVMASAKYTDALKPGKEFEYDSELFQKLRGNFG